MVRITYRASAGRAELLRERERERRVPLPAPCSLLPFLQPAFRSLMDPLTVDRSSRRPPLPIVPFKRRGPNFPVIVRGKSVSISPFRVVALTSVERLAGRSSVIPPFTVAKSSASVHVAFPIDATIEPFTVRASAYPVVEIRMLPFTVVASTSLERFAASTLPFTVAPRKRTPSGTRPVKSTRTSLFRVLVWSCSPGSQVFSRRPSLGYTAQIVTPSSEGTTSIFTSSGSPRCALLTPVTSTSPHPATASMSPLMPLISMVLPAAIFPFQWKSPWAATRDAARVSPIVASASVTTRMVIPPPDRRDPRACLWTPARGGRVGCRH